MFQLFSMFLDMVLCYSNSCIGVFETLLHWHSFKCQSHLSHKKFLCFWSKLNCCCFYLSMSKYRGFGMGTKDEIIALGV